MAIQNYLVVTALITLMTCGVHYSSNGLWLQSIRALMLVVVIATWQLPLGVTFQANMCIRVCQS